MNAKCVSVVSTYYINHLACIREKVNTKDPEKLKKKNSKLRGANKTIKFVRSFFVSIFYNLKKELFVASTELKKKLKLRLKISFNDYF